jgi:nitroreductase
MLYDLVKQNRSIRRFVQSDLLSETEVLSILELARYCPSAANLQQLRFCYSLKPELNEKIFLHLSWAGYLRYWDGPAKGERPAAYIIMLSPVNVSKFHHIDTGIMAQTMLLGATELGFGGCQIASVNKAELHKELALPEDYEIVLVLALGRPAEEVIVEDVIDPDDIEYWRDDNGIHHVPKRLLSDLIIPL